MTKEAISKAPVGRVRRTPVGKRNILSVVGKEDGYEYRFVNDTGDRVQSFMENGWETVPSDGVRVGDKRIDAASPEGSVAKASVGGGMKAVLLRIKKEYYEEDQLAKQSLVNASEEATRQKALDGTYGKLEISRALEK
jgi:hypothetical protein